MDNSKLTIEDLYKKFVDDQFLEPLDQTQDMYLKRFFFAGFTAYRDLTIEDLQRMTHDEQMRYILGIDEEIREFWEKDSKGSAS